MESDGQATHINLATGREVTPTPANGGIYSLTGVSMGCKADRLPKGVYIVNGKKMIVR